MTQKAKNGWIGIDVGTSTVKVAQLTQRGGRWQLANTAIVARRSPWPAAPESGKSALTSVDELQAARSLEPGFQGRRVAATLPMSCCDVLAVDQVLECNPRNDTLVRKHVATATQRATDDLAVNYWSVEGSRNDSQVGWTNVMTQPTAWGDHLCDDIARAGWSCQTLDGVPFALARAVSMVTGGDSDQLTAVLDWGVSRATFCVVQAGRPIYVRCLKDCAFGRVLGDLSEQLQISHEEAERLLRDQGLPAVPGRGVAQLIAEIIAGRLEQLVSEIARSMEHFGYQRRCAPPEELYLVGGGASVLHLDSCLASRLDLPVHLWKLPQGEAGQFESEEPDSFLFASAAALSILAWPTAQGGVG